VVTPPPYLGALLAALAPMCWAGAVILYRKTDLHPTAMNLFKNGLSLGLLTVTMAVLGVQLPADRPLGDWATLAVSGLLGLAIGDTLLFEGLRRIGAARLALVDTTYAPLMVAMAWAFLGERPGTGFLVGAAAVVVGNAIANVDLRQALQGSDDRVPMGLLMAFGAIVGSGASVILVKSILEASSLVEITWTRLVAGIVGQVLWVTARGEWRDVAPALLPSAQWRFLLPGAFLGTYVALLLWLGGFKWADASLAAILNQLATVYIIALAWLLLGETVSPRQLGGAFVAVAGAAVVLLT